MNKNVVAISDLACELWDMGERSGKMIRLCEQILKCPEFFLCLTANFSAWCRSHLLPLPPPTSRC